MATPTDSHPCTLPTILGQCVTLRALRPADAPLLHRYLQDRRVISRLERLPQPYTIECSEGWVTGTLRMAAEATGYHFGIALAETDEIVGMMGLNDVNWDDRNAEIGYWMARPFWRRGLTEEALRLLLKFSFRTLRFRRAWAAVIETNPASYKLLEKVGFTREAVRREARRKGNRWLDLYIYGMLREEYAP